MRLPIVTPARVRHATWLALLIPCWAGGPAGAQVPAEDPRVARLVQVVRAGMDAYGIPGSVLAISIGGQRVTRALGATSVENPLPITEGTLFQIGSITKTMTALAVMRLVDQGRLSLDAPLREALPDFRVRDPDATQRATLRTTLTHMGGWEGDLFEDPGAETMPSHCWSGRCQRSSRSPPSAPCGPTTTQASVRPVASSRSRRGCRSSMRSRPSSWNPSAWASPGSLPQTS